MEMQFFEFLVAIVAIISVFGVGGYIVVKIIQLIRDWLVSRREPKDQIALQRKLEQYEQRQEQLLKRIQNLETIVVDADLGNPKLEAHREQDKADPNASEEIDRPLKNKLRS